MAWAKPQLLSLARALACMRRATFSFRKWKKGEAFSWALVLLCYSLQAHASTFLLPLHGGPLRRPDSAALRRDITFGAQPQTASGGALIVPERNAAKTHPETIVPERVGI